MNTFLSRLLTFLLMAALQILIFGRICLFGVGTPLIYLWFILTLNTTLSRNKLMLWAFAMGLTVDIFFNTPGVNAAASTMTAFLRPALLRFFSPRDANTFSPHIESMGFVSFLNFIFVSSLFHLVVVTLLTFFSFDRPMLMLLFAGLGTLLTTILLLALEFLRTKS